MEIEITPKFFEDIIIKFLFTDFEIRDKIFPFLNPRLFQDKQNEIIITKFLHHHSEYDNFPTISEMNLELSNDDTFKHLMEIKELDTSEFKDEYLLHEIEDFFKKKLINDVIVETAVNLNEDKMEEISKAPDDLREALSFGFDTKIGLDFINESKTIYDALHNKDRIIQSGLNSLDRIIEGGFHEKSLSLFMAETNLGKSLVMCSLASNALLQNKNVLYISLEMAEHKISQRIMANMFDISMDELKNIPEDKFHAKFDNLKKKLSTRLVIKEYPTRSINTNHIRNLLKELSLKKKFVPDIIFVDYIGIMLASHISKGDNTYVEVKRISEELRGLAVECKVPIISAVQTNRGGFGNAQIDLTDIADSIGTTATADLIIGIMQTPENRTLGKFTWIILKNRYGLNKQVFGVCVDYFKMRVYEDETINPDNIAPPLPPSDEQKDKKVKEGVAIVSSALNKDLKDKLEKHFDYE
jgi:archaellum biogenesis ATPase FlaH